MITYNIKAGTTDVSVVIRIIDSTDGTPETGVVYNTSGIDLEYRREGATSTDITEATLAGLDSAHSDGGFLHIGNGYYRLDLPDAACAAGANGVLVHGTVTGMVVIGCYIQLTNIPVDVIAVSGDTTAADNLESYCDGTTPIPANTTQLSGDATAADNAESFFDGTGYAGTNNVIPTVTTVTNLHASAATAAELAKVPKSDSNVTWNATALGSIQSECDDALVANNLDHLCKTATAAADMTTEVADNTVIARILANGDTSAFDPSTDGLQPWHDALGSETTLADAIWDEALSGHTTAGTAGKALADAGSAGDPWSTAIPGAYGAGTAGKIVGDNLNATVSSRSSHSAADVWAVATRVLTAGTNIALAKGTGVTGFTDIDAAGVRTAVGLASANLDTQLAALPTDADVNAACDTAISDAALATAAALATVDSNVDAILADTGTDGVVVAAASKTGYALTAAYDPAKTAAQAGDAMTLTVAYDAAKTASQAGDAMTLTAAYDASKTAAQAGDAMTLTAAYDLAKTAAQSSDIPTAVENADALLGRNLAGGADGGRTVKDALRALRNKSAIAAGTLTVYAENDIDAAWTATVATTAGDPISSVDPA